MAVQKSKTGLRGNKGSTILIVLLLVILAWAYKTCQRENPRNEPPALEAELEAKNYPVIFISIDSLNMRSGPALDSTIVSKLRHGEPLLYLNERTKFRQKINFEGQLQNEPWVKVRTRAGVEGWIYAAGAKYYPAD